MNNIYQALLSILLTVSLVVFLRPVGQAAVKGAPSGETGQVLQSEGQESAPEGTPTWEIQSIEKKMDEYKTGKNLTEAEKAHNKKLKLDILNGTFDLRELSRLALDQHWSQISTSEQSNFVNLMTNLLETKAIFSKEQSKVQGKAYVVRYKGDKYLNGKSKAQTLTEIHVPKEGVTLDIEYKLRKSSDGWKVFDIIVDDASLVENYRYQFDKIITKHGYAELVRRMRNKLNELQSKPS